MNEQAIRFRVGVFVLAMVITLGILIVLFGSRPGWFTRHYRYTVTFRDATGVGTGTPVRRSGVKIGEADAVHLDNETGLVHVGIIVDRNYPLHQGDRVRLVRGVLGGDAAIDFVTPRPGAPTPDLTPAEPGTEFTGVEQSGLEGLLAQGSEVLPTTQAAMNDLRVTLQRYERVAPQIEETLREYRDLARETRAAVPDLRQGGAEFQAASRRWNQLGERLTGVVQDNEPRLARSLDNLNAAVVRAGRFFDDDNQKALNEGLKNLRSGTANLDAMTRDLDAFVKETRESLRSLNSSVRRLDDILANLQVATKPLADRSPALWKNLDEGAAQFNHLLTDARQLLGTFGRSEGTLGLLLSDPSLYRNLNDAACMVTRILPRLDRILHDVEIFADKIARHPESLGVGGVIHPGSGLKR